MIRMQKLDLLAQFIQSQVAATENRPTHEFDNWRRNQWQLAIEEALRCEPIWN
jgi:hypothetical protein